MNQLQAFLFDDLDIRGRFVRLSDEWQHWQQKRDYPPAANELLGQCAAFIALVGGDIKHASGLTLQLRSPNTIKTLLVQCQVTQDRLELRGMIDAPALNDARHLRRDLAGGDLALTLYNPITRTDYQSLVPVEDDNASALFASYLAQSVQQPCLLWLHADASQCTGLLLEKMPDADHKDPDGWARISQLASTLSVSELTSLSLQQLLHRLFHQEQISLYTPLPVVYHCPDEREKVANMLRSLGRDECERLLIEQGEILVSNDVCARDYRFDVQDVASLFASPTLQ